MNDIPVSLFNFGLILALVPICQGLVQMIKTEFMSTTVTRLLSVVIGIGLTFLVRQSGVEGVSNLIGNPYLAVLTGLVTSLIASGMYNMAKNDIIKDAVTSKTDTSVPSKLVDNEEKVVEPIN